MDAGQRQAVSSSASGSSRRWRFIRLWRRRSRDFDAVIIGPGSFYTSLMPIFLVRGVADALREMKGPVILVSNLLTEGRGMLGFTAADAVARIEEAIQRPVDVVLTNNKWPSPKVLGRYALEHKEPLAHGHPARALRSWSAANSGQARSRATIVCVSPYAVWTVLSRRLLAGDRRTPDRRSSSV